MDQPVTAPLTDSRATGPVAPAVVARSCTLTYGGHRAVEDATFTLPSGSVSALIGPNGSGKSTLLAAMAGLLEPVAGSLEVLGREARRARGRVAFVLQTTKVNDHLPATVREVVTMGRFARRGALGLLRREDRRAVDDALERLAIADLATRQLGELSGGQRQRAFVAQGLVQEADVLLLDEPVTGLDIVSKQLILDAIRAERDAGRTVVVSTHDLVEASSADVVVLLARRVVACGAPAAVLQREHLEAAYGGRLVKFGDDELLVVDDPHHHAEGHDHGVCEDDH